MNEATVIAASVVTLSVVSAVVAVTDAVRENHGGHHIVLVVVLAVADVAVWLSILAL